MWQSLVSWVRTRPARVASGNTPKGIGTSLVLQKIRETRLMAGLPAESLKALYQHVEGVRVRAGRLIIREGVEGDYYDALTQGMARITRQDPSGHVVTVADIEEPCAFGEETLISNRPRNATVTNAPRWPPAPPLSGSFTRRADHPLGTNPGQKPGLRSGGSVRMLLSERSAQRHRRLSASADGVPHSGAPRGASGAAPTGVKRGGRTG